MKRQFIGRAVVVLAIWAHSVFGESIDFCSFEEGENGIAAHAMDARLEFVSGKAVTDGKRALAIEFEIDANWTGATVEADEAVDTSGLGDCYLIFDAYNPGEYSVFLSVRVASGTGVAETRAASIPAGSKGSYYFELRGPSRSGQFGLRDDPPSFSIDATKLIIRGLKYTKDFSTVKSVEFRTSRLLHEKKLVIDNMRIESSPEHDPDFLVGIVDRFGQNAKLDFQGKVKDEAHLKALADAELRELAVSMPMADRSRFGGWKEGPRFEATGYFRTRKVGDRWALVDPDGYLFFSSGIANVRMANSSTFTGIDFRDESARYRDPEDVTPEDSVGMVRVSEKVRSTRYVVNETRYGMFVELPSYDSELENHYSYRRSTHRGPVPHGETFSFYQANLERRYGERFPGSYLQTWRDVTLDRMIDWGFTSFGNWIAPEFYHAKRFPYFANGWIIGDFQRLSSGFDYWGPIPDPYDPEFERRAKSTTKVVADEVLNSPWCIGIFIDNEMSWGAEGNFGIALDAIRKPVGESFAKQAFSAILREKHETIDALNRAWGTDIDSWIRFEEGIDFRDSELSDGMREDLSILKEALATKYFQVVHDALEEVLPNHLYMGARFATWSMSKEINAGAKKYVDVMSYNSYTEGIGVAKWEFLKDFDMPCIIGEYHFGARDSGVFNSGIIEAADQRDRARMYTEYMKSVLRNPRFVGAHWFQYFDSPLTGRAHDGENYNVGFVSNADVPYPEMVGAAKAFHQDMYPRLFGEEKSE